MGKSDILYKKELTEYGGRGVWFVQTDKILMVDSAWSNCELLRRKVESRNARLLQEPDFERGIRRFNEEAPSFVIVNANAGRDVNEFIAQIRKNSNIPVLVMAQEPQVLDRITALEVGADDYISVPFDPDEVIARIRAIYRRYNSKSGLGKNSREVVYPGLHINLTNYELTLDGVPYTLPPKELNLLFLMASNPNLVFTREQLMDRVWGFECYSDLRTVDVHIKRLRQKLAGHEKGWAIVTVRGVGYKFSTK